MKLLILSDLHLEFYREPSGVIESFPKDGFDVVVLAGDIVSGARFREDVERLCDYFAPTPIVFVCGNHEYYHTNRQMVASALRGTERRKSNFTWLENGSTEVHGRKIIGTTMWFRQNAVTNSQSGFLCDFRLIERFREWNYKTNAEAIAFLNANVSADTIVVTHHLPTEHSVHAKYKGDPFNCFFLCDVEPLILDKKPPLWIHGHTHETVDCVVGETRVVCNPMGYPHEGGSQFSGSKIVEV